MKTATAVERDKKVSQQDKRIPQEFRSRSYRRTVLIWITRLGLTAVILGSWQIAADTKAVNPTFTSRPSSVWNSFLGLFGTRVISTDLPTTLEETLLGFAIGVIVGFLLGAVIAQVEILNVALRPLIAALNSLPRIAFAPLFVIWFGLGKESKVALAVSLVVFIMLTNTVAGLTAADRDMMLLAKTLGASETQRLRKFVLPAAVPTLSAGIELSLIYSFLAVVSGEIIGGTSGLGVALNSDANQFETAQFFAILLLLAIISSIMVLLLSLASGRLLRWHQIEMRSEP